MRDTSIVPSVMFHTVGLESKPWVWSHISESVDNFEHKLKLLKKYKFNAVTWAELYSYMAGELELPANSIFLTFDDGYLDNWVYIYPLLKKYGMKGTIFVNPDFVDPETTPRANLEDVWAGEVNKSDLFIDGFLSWEEMRQMESSGVIDIQSHAKTHTWYFTGPEVVDLHYKKAIDDHPWLAWNLFPDQKSFYLRDDQQSLVQEGYPVLEHKKSLVAKRFFPDENQLHKVIEHVQAIGTQSYLSQRNWQEKIGAFMRAEFGKEQIDGHYESDEEQVERIYQELAESKATIEKHLGKTVDYICWPGGGNDQIVQDMAVKAGYKSWTLGSQDLSSYRNKPLSNPQYIKRIGSETKLEFRGRIYGYGSNFSFLLRVLGHQNSTFHSYQYKAYKLVRLIGSYLGLK
ncbi:polysaccharide deacetylase family protein [Oceanicoccus sagamiensis]|uniref:NodB homology domain-containing protein n=1 Tax=Oceanicoccus sagamiensis TaxID=716816 RepID=A0A1X9N7P1_9GAMM|nr:polysaccharide deacetylase family protein [Oceanicoccus sagamiensis]ARN74090.1 hypothetical protein BST96_08120 [Oceanicoccus sagamiensis]